MASVQCAVVEGDLPLEITWMFGDREIKSDRTDIIISASGKRLKQLTIEAVAAWHAGEYTCVASNEAGSVSKSAILKVNGISDLYSAEYSKFVLSIKIISIRVLLC